MEIILLLVYNYAMLWKSFLKFFDKLEYKVRGKLSHYPILYAFVGGTGIILFWRGVWHIADDLNLQSGASLVIGLCILLMTGVFVSEFIGNRLIISGLVGEKKLARKEESEIETEETQLKNLQTTLNKIETKLDHMNQEVEGL